MERTSAAFRQESIPAVHPILRRIGNNFLFDLHFPPILSCRIIWSDDEDIFSFSSRSICLLYPLQPLCRFSIGAYLDAA